MPGPFDRFNDRAKRVLALAQDEAIRMDHEHLGVEHLGLALIREGGGLAARALDSLGVDATKFRVAIEKAVPRGDPDKEVHEGRTIQMTPRMQRIIQLANDEATRLGSQTVGTEHLLLAIAKEGQSVTSSVLRTLGVAMDQVVDEVTRIVRDGGSDFPRRPPPRT